MEELTLKLPKAALDCIDLVTTKDSLNHYVEEAIKFHIMFDQLEPVNRDIIKDMLLSRYENKS